MSVDIDKIIKLSKMGLSGRDISKKTGVQKDKVAKILRTFKLSSPQPIKDASESLRSSTPSICAETLRAMNPVDMPFSIATRIEQSNQNQVILKELFDILAKLIKQVAKDMRITDDVAQAIDVIKNGMYTLKFYDDSLVKQALHISQQQITLAKTNKLKDEASKDYTPDYVKIQKALNEIQLNVEILPADRDKVEPKSDDN